MYTNIYHMDEALKIIECKGYTKEEAFADLDFDPNHVAIPGCNATQAWSKAGKPMPGTKDFKRFVTQQLNEKTKNVPGLGIHIVIDSPIKDTKKRPYTIINKKTEGVRDWHYSYFIQETELSINELPNIETDIDGNAIKGANDLDITILKRGAIVDAVDNKAEALQRVKELTTETHKDYTILVVQVPNISPIAGYSIYTPSAGTKKGTWIAAGFNAK